MTRQRKAVNVWWMSTGISESIQFLLIGFIILVYFNLYIFYSFLLLSKFIVPWPSGTRWFIVAAYMSGLHVVYSTANASRCRSLARVCIGHDHETLKNKVKNLLTWVQVRLIFIFIFIRFYLFLYISDWLTIYDRAAPRNRHDLPGQWPVKLRRTRLFLHQSLAN